MRLCLILVVILVALVLLAENTEARRRKQSSLQAEEEGDLSKRESRRRANKESKRDRKDKKGHGRHEEDQSAHVDEMVKFDDINTEDQMVSTETPVAEPAAEVSQDTSEEGEEEHATPKKGKKRRGPKENGPSMTKEERKAMRHEHRVTNAEGKRDRMENRQDKLARKEARKQAKRAENQVHKEERKQARKEAKKMERQANRTSDCSEHTDCTAGSCCQQRGPVKTCRAFNKGQDSMCFNDCVCSEGFECFIREGKKQKHPEGDAKGHCRPKQTPEITEGDQAQEDEN